MNAQTLSKPGTPADEDRIFRLLIAYRWLSLIPVLLALVAGDGAGSAILLAALANLSISLFRGFLNTGLRSRPWLLLVDLIFCAILVRWNGGWETSYYLYIFSPILAAAFFFNLRGSLLAAAGMSGLFILAGLGEVSPGQNWLQLVAQVVGLFLIAGTFGYATTLMTHLRASHAELGRAHRDLEVIHNLTLSLQHATEVSEVEKQVLEVVTGELHFPRAVIALVDEDKRALTSWAGRTRQDRALFDTRGSYQSSLPLSAEEDILHASLNDGKERLNVKEIATRDEQLNAALSGGVYHIFPMFLREHPVGVLLVDVSGGQEVSRLESLQTIAHQAVVALGTTLMCIDRAQTLAVHEERLRIARDIHDTVFQSLFGISYALDACARLLPDHPAEVKAELESLNKLAESARGQLRGSVLNLWPSELTADRFTEDLRLYVNDYCRLEGMELLIHIHGEFQSLPAGHRRGLYRIAQEALANVIRHADATRASLELTIDELEATMAIQDDGRGFSPERVLSNQRDREHFGLRSIQERAAALDGKVKITSQPGSGTLLLVTLPLHTEWKR